MSILGLSALRRCEDVSGEATQASVNFLEKITLVYVVKEFSGILTYFLHTQMLAKNQSF